MARGMNMESDYCLNMNCGHHRKDHSGVTGPCRKCACRQGRYVEAEKGKHLVHGGAPKKGGGHTA